MQKIEHKINLNMSQPNNFEYIHAMQGDYDAEFVIATLYDKNTIYNIDSSTKVILQGATEFDELIVYDNIIINDDRHSVTFPLTKEMLSTSGNISFILSFIDLNTNQKKSAFPFIVKNTKEITASTPVLILQAITDYVNRAEKAAKDAEANKNITDENAAQSKQYLETTKEQADIATTKAQESSSSAVDSANSAIQSSKSATIANEKAEVASTKATEASSSATNAAQSEANAKKSFDEVTRLEQSVIDHKNAVTQSTNNAEESAKKSESWAVGGTSTRDGEDTENSKYYAEQAKNYADKAQQATVQIVVDSELSETSTNPVENKVINTKISNIEEIINNVSSTANGAMGTLNLWYGQGRIPKGIANNLVTTEEGYALDARQGEALDGKIRELKKSVSDGKSAVASAITNAGVSTASDASFATMSSNIAKVRTDTTYTDKSHIIYGETAYVQGKKVTGTMPSYKGNIFYFGGFANLIGNDNLSMWTGGRCSLYLAVIRRVKMTFSLTGSSGNINTPTTGVYSDGFGDTYFKSHNNNGYVQCFASNEQTIDFTGYDKILVRARIRSDIQTGSYYLRGWIGVTEAISGDTSGEGQSEMIAKAMYNATSKDEWEYFEQVIDVSNLTGQKYMKVSVVHSGIVQILSCTFLPKREF